MRIPHIIVHRTKCLKIGMIMGQIFTEKIVQEDLTRAKREWKGILKIKMSNRLIFIYHFWEIRIDRIECIKMVIQQGDAR